MAVAILSFTIPMLALANHVLNCETGEFFEGEYSDQELWPVINNYEDETGVTVECSIPYAFVTESPWYPGCVRWLVPGFVYSDWEGKPEVSISGFSLTLPDGYRSVAISVVEAEYKDFNYTLQPGLPPVPDSEPQRFVDIEPYQGFYPTQPFNDNGIGKYRDTYIAFIGVWPVLYDYENSIVRAYTYLKLRIEYKQEEAGASGIETDDAPAEYFTLQGIKVATPAKGALYIKRTGSRTQIIAY